MLPSCFQVLAGWATDHTAAMAHLTQSLAWNQREIRMYGRTVMTPRLTSWIGDGSYSYSGIEHAPAAWNSELAGYRDAIARHTGARFNSCLANHYRDGADSVAWHADDEPELGAEPTIASLSLGAARRFQVRHRATGETWTLELGQGDLLIMSGESQRDYLHAVPKTKRPTGPRINLTFRTVF